MESVKKLIDKRALHKREYNNKVNERQMQKIEEKVNTSKTLDASLVNTKSNGIKSGKHDTSSSLGNDVDADDADIKLVYDEEQMAEVQLTAKNNVFAIGNNILSNLNSIIKERLTIMLNNVMTIVLYLLN
nr:hypothetical protein [Tanacetum cinerariifolium]